MKAIRIIVLSIIAISAQGQVADSADLSTPYSTLWTHLTYLQPDNYNVSLAAQPFEPTRRGKENAESSTIKLKQVLDGNGIFIYMDEVPKNPNYYDSALNKNKYIITDRYPAIYLVQREESENWVFADASVVAIEDAHQKYIQIRHRCLT